MESWSRLRYTHSFWSMFAWSHGAGFATLTVSGVCLHGVMEQASLHSQFLEYVCMESWSRLRYTHSFWSMFAWSHGAGFATLTVSGVCLHGVMEQASLHSQFLEYVCMESWSRLRYTHSFWSMFAWSHGAGFPTLTVSGVCLHGVMEQASLHSQFLEYVCMESWSRLRYTLSFWSIVHLLVNMI